MIVRSRFSQKSPPIPNLAATAAETLANIFLLGEELTKRREESPNYEQQYGEPMVASWGQVDLCELFGSVHARSIKQWRDKGNSGGGG